MRIYRLRLLTRAIMGLRMDADRSDCHIKQPLASSKSENKEFGYARKDHHESSALSSITTGRATKRPDLWTSSQTCQRNASTSMAALITIQGRRWMLYFVLSGQKVTHAGSSCIRHNPCCPVDH